MFVMVMPGMPPPSVSRKKAPFQVAAPPTVVQVLASHGAEVSVGCAAGLDVGLAVGEWVGIAVVGDGVGASVIPWQLKSPPSPTHVLAVVFHLQRAWRLPSPFLWKKARMHCTSSSRAVQKRPDVRAVRLMRLCSPAQRSSCVAGACVGHGAVGAVGDGEVGAGKGAGAGGGWVGWFSGHHGHTQSCRPSEP